MQLEVPAELVPYITHNYKVDPEAQKKLTEELENFIRNNKGMNMRVKRKYKNTQYTNPKEYLCTGRVFLIGYNEAMREIDTEIFQYESSNLLARIEEGKKLLNLVTANAGFVINMHDFVKDSTEKCSKNPHYQLLKERKKTIKRKLKRILIKSQLPNYSSLLKVELINASNRYNEDLQYSPPSTFDEILADFIIHSPLGATVEPTACVIAEGTTESAVYAIREFSDQIYKRLNITSPASQDIVYYSVVRFLFNEAYVIKSDLSGYNRANAQFLEKCLAFSRQSVRDLKLDDNLVRGYTAGLPVASLFKYKQVGMLDIMELMTNPLDLMFHVHEILGAIASFFGTGGEFLSLDDTLTLLLGLMSINPPVNGVSIAKFVERWADLQISSLISVAKNYFIAAVNHLMNLKEIEGADDAKEFFE